MCFGGGGGGGGTITMPDTGAYDRMLDRQIAAMQSEMNGAAQLKQAELQTAQQAQQAALSKLSDYRTEKADEFASVEAEARRLMNIVGAPPPEKSAKAPVTGDTRRSSTRKTGKRGLRISRSSANSSGYGTGLNIT